MCRLLNNVIVNNYFKKINIFSLCSSTLGIGNSKFVIISFSKERFCVWAEINYKIKNDIVCHCHLIWFTRFIFLKKVVWCSPLSSWWYRVSSEKLTPTVEPEPSIKTVLGVTATSVSVYCYSVRLLHFTVTHSVSVKYKICLHNYKVVLFRHVFSVQLTQSLR